VVGDGEVVGDGDVVGEAFGDAWGEGVTGVGEGEGFKGVVSEPDRTKATPNNSGPCRSVLGSNSNFLVVKLLSAQLS
jgi:hypothetical protein